MYNLGNTCFMSATLQCLIHCKPLQEQFLSKLEHPYQTCNCVRAGSKTTSCLTCEMDKVFLKYYGNSVGIDAIASLEEQPSHSTDTNPTTTRVAPSDSRGHPIIPSNLLAEIWKCRVWSTLQDMPSTMLRNFSMHLWTASQHKLLYTVSWHKKSRSSYTKVKSRGLSQTRIKMTHLTKVSMWCNIVILLCSVLDMISHLCLLA